MELRDGNEEGNPLGDEDGPLWVGLRDDEGSWEGIGDGSFVGADVGFSEGGGVEVANKAGPHPKSLS